MRHDAIYPGSFDPITNGHLDIIERILPLYDKLIIVVANKTDKNYMFSLKDRKLMVQNSLAELKINYDNVCIITAEEGYLVKYAKNNNIRTIIRGVRNNTDFEYEHNLAMINKDIEPSIETLFIQSSLNTMYISSELVKNHIKSANNWKEQVAKLVPANVLLNLKEKNNYNRAITYWNDLIIDINSPESHLNLTIDSVKSNQVLSEILKNYTENNRYYHNLNHIVTMLDDKKLGRYSIYNISLRLAIWFHDIILTNEKDSNKMAIKLMKRLRIPRYVRKSVSELILATVYDKPIKNLNYTQKIIRDVDFCILGKSKEEYEEYIQGVRAENASLSDEVFYEKRKEFLLNILNNQPIFKVDFIRNKYEEQARVNICNELKNITVKLPH